MQGNDDYNRIYNEALVSMKALGLESLKDVREYAEKMWHKQYGKKDIRYQIAIDTESSDTNLPEFMYVENLDEFMDKYTDILKAQIMQQFQTIPDEKKEKWFGRLQWDIIEKMEHADIIERDSVPSMFINDRDEYGITNYDNWVQDDSFNPFSDVNPKTEFCPHCDADMRPQAMLGATECHSAHCPMSDAEKDWISNGHAAAERISDGKGVPIQQDDICLITEKAIHTTTSGGRSVPACDICGSLPNEHGLCPMAQKTDEELDMERRVHGSAETCTRSYTVIPGYRGRMSRIQRDAWNEKNRHKLKVRIGEMPSTHFAGGKPMKDPHRGETVGTYDTKPVWKRTFDTIVYADFLDGNGIVSTPKRQLDSKGSDAVWKTEPCTKGLFVYVTTRFTEEVIQIQSSYGGSLRHLKLSKAQSKKVREFYGDNPDKNPQWEGII